MNLATPHRSRTDSATLHLGASASAGVLAGLVAAVSGAGVAAVLVGWDVAAAMFTGWVWLLVRGLDGNGTKSRASDQNPSRAATDVTLISAAVASLGAVAVVLLGASHAAGLDKLGLTAFAVASLMSSWLLVHTLFALRYARLYYTGPDGGVDFNSDERPRYGDFLYLSFTIGMTFQVSDTNLTSQDIRRTALRHALLSYLFGAVIIAVAINLVAGLTK